MCDALVWLLAATFKGRTLQRLIMIATVSPNTSLVGVRIDGIRQSLNLKLRTPK